MSHYPGARWRPISRNVGGSIEPRAVVWHTAADGPSVTSLYSWFNSSKRNGTSAHGFIAGNGAMEQYIDTRRAAGHAFAANAFALGIETHDGGHPLTPWTPQQIARMVDFMRWCHDTHGVPLRMIDGPKGSGHGYHCQYGAWNKSDHSCPGSTRIRQLPLIVALAAGATPIPQAPTANATPTTPVVPIGEGDEDMNGYLFKDNAGTVWLTDGFAIAQVEADTTAELQAKISQYLFLGWARNARDARGQVQLSTNQQLIDDVRHGHL